MTRRIPGPLAVSIAVHLVVGAALLQVLRDPYRIGHFFERSSAAPEVERIGFISLPDLGTTPTAGRSGGDGRPPREPREAPPLRAPATVPTELPPLPEGTPAPEEGSGPIVGGGGPMAGIRPSYSDPRVWARPGPYVTAPKTAKARLDSVIASRIGQHHDSLAALGTPRDPTDWTFERNGKKYGIDRDYIRLGDVSIPTAVLALLPLNVQGNPIAIEREKRLNAMHADIAEHAQRSVNEDEFRAAVKRIRERKDRERAAARQTIAGREEAAAREKAGGSPPDGTSRP